MLCGWSIIEKSETEAFMDALKAILQAGNRDVESDQLDIVKGFLRLNQWCVMNAYYPVNPIAELMNRQWLEWSCATSSNANVVQVLTSLESLLVKMELRFGAAFVAQ